MKKVITTFGLTVLVLVLTSFTAPQTTTTVVDNTNNTEIVNGGITGRTNPRLDGGITGRTNPRLEGGITGRTNPRLNGGITGRTNPRLD